MPEVNAREFDEAHGGVDESVIIDVWRVFPDGAMRRADVLTAGKCEGHGPPADAYKRWQIIEQYHEARLEIVSAEFRHLKSSLKAAAEEAATTGKVNVNVSTFKNPQLAELERLKKLAERHKRGLNKARKQVEASKPQKLKDAEAWAEKTRQQGDEMLAALANINI